MAADNSQGERQPLLPSQHAHTNTQITPNGRKNSQPNGNGKHSTQDESSEGDGTKVEFEKEDSGDPQNWSFWKALSQTIQICLIAFICPMASSMFAPAFEEISTEYGVDKQIVLLGQSLFVVLLGIGPLFLAPMSETFGRRPIFLGCLAVFTMAQLGTAVAGSVEVFLVMRALSGLFGSVGVANGGGTISDVFEKHQRAKVLGVYLICPLLGPSIGPLIGGVVVARMEWRWIFWILFILSASITIICYFFLHETRAIVILQQRKGDLEKKDPDAKFYVEGVSDMSLFQKVAGNSTRAIKILVTQPIVLIMSLYQALVFSTMYTLYSQYSTIWTAPPYNFNKTQLGLAYLGPAIGFIFTAFFIVAYIDKLYNYLSNRNDDDGQPEYRLPMANIGAILLPISLFWFAWTIDKGFTWQVPLAATLLFGASQVSIFNTVQTYYIDAYTSNAASALAAGAFLRSLVGGIVPLFVSGLFDSVGFGWGMSVFGFLSVLLMPAPLIFYWVGRRLREKFSFKG